VLILPSIGTVPFRGGLKWLKWREPLPVRGRIFLLWAAPRGRPGNGACDYFSRGEGAWPRRPGRRFVLGGPPGAPARVQAGG
jgi:hypothetical protein